MTEHEQQILELEKDILFQKEYVNGEVFSIFANSVRDSNYNTRLDNTPMDSDEIRFNRIENLWDQGKPTDYDRL